MGWLADPLLLLENDDVRAEFGAADLGEIRQKVTSHSVPPPGWVKTDDGLLQTIVVRDHEDQTSFLCGLPVDDQAAFCMQQFKSANAVRMHQSSAGYQKQSRPFSVSTMCTCQKCPWCSTSFPSDESGRNHVRRAFEKRGCVANRSVKPVKCVEVDEEVVCPNCSVHFEDWYGFQIHCEEMHGSPESGFVDLRVAGKPVF